MTEFIHRTETTMSQTHRQSRVLITGGGSGIGLATAAGSSSTKAPGSPSPAATQAKLDEAAKRARRRRPAARATPPTSPIPSRSRRSSKRSTKQLGRIDILVNNAGTNIKDRTFRELTPEAGRQLIRTNLDGAFYCIHAVFPGMLRAQGRR